MSSYCALVRDDRSCRESHFKSNFTAPENGNGETENWKKVGKKGASLKMGKRQIKNISKVTK